MLVEEGNEGLFIDNLLYFLRNKDSKQKFGEKAKKYTLGHFGWDIICDRYIDQYKKILNK
jgi:glycosyltransferase involved in cell wall biosynthesis